MTQSVFSLDTDDFSHFSDVFNTIAEETGISVPHKLTIKADVHTVAHTDFGLVDEEFSQTLSTTLGGNTLEWEEELVPLMPSGGPTGRRVTKIEQRLRMCNTGNKSLKCYLCLNYEKRVIDLRVNLPQEHHAAKRGLL